MPLGLRCELRGDDVIGAIGGELRKQAAASDRARQYAAANTKTRLRAATVPGLGPRVANAWRDRNYPNATAQGVDGRAMVWTRAPNIIQSAEEAPLIQGHGGGFLAIPTKAAGAGKGGARITPNEFKKRTGIPLRPIRTRNGNVLLVAQEQNRKFRRGAGGRLLGRQRGGGFATKTYDPRKDFVVVFILVREVQMRKLLDREPIADQGQTELAEFLETLLNAA